ncbi:MAG: DotG/IcmE/VirB10 family protein [Alphaproteobacteria bacterium]|nr:DotG/IcmE/VirB10 family protein [Alphaproteobacteria bacterium]
MSDDDKPIDDDIDNEFDTDGFDVDDFDDDGFDDLATTENSLADLWKNNPFVKIGVILGALALLILGIILFGGKNEKDPTSRVARSRDLTEAPGTAEVTEAYRQAVEEENTRRTEEALRQGESAVPTPVEAPKGTLPLQFEEPAEEDPLERWRRMQEERIRQQQIQQQVEPQEPPEPEVDTKTPAVNAMAQAMAQQMESVLANQPINGMNVQPVATMAYLEALAEKQRQQLEAALAAQQQQLEEDGEEVEILIPAGTIEYAYMLTEANTDAPGPILAQIATGPLKGARIIGNFAATNDYLTMNFSTAVLDGVDYAANAVAIDPDTTLPGVVTDIDRRYWQRVILPMAAEFVEGLTEAIADSGRTSVTISGDTVSETTSNQDLSRDQKVASGIAEAGEELSNIFGEMFDGTQPLIRVRAGTPIGVLFVSPVTDQPQLLQNVNDPGGVGATPPFGTQPVQPFNFSTSTGGIANPLSGVNLNNLGQ